MTSETRHYLMTIRALRSLGFEPDEAGRISVVGMNVDVTEIAERGFARALEVALEQGVGVRWERADVEASGP